MKKSKNEPLITILKWEYDELISIKEKFVLDFNEKKTILFHDSFFVGGMGAYTKHNYSIVNESEIIKSLSEELEAITKEKDALMQSNSKLQELHKKWYEYIPMRKWYQLVPLK